MEQMLIVHISSLSAIIILSIVLLVNSIKTKNKLVMYLSIGTLVVSIGCLTYCLIHHFNKQHQDEKNKKMVGTLIKKLTHEDGWEMAPVKLTNCLQNQKTINDLTKILLASNEDITKLYNLLINYKPSPDQRPTEQEQKMLAKFLEALILVATADCSDDIAKIKSLTPAPLPPKDPTPKEEK